MSAATAELEHRIPMEALIQAADADAVHLFCCDDDRTMCGLIFAGPITDVADDQDVTCSLCALVEGQSCGKPGCPHGS